MSHARHEHDGLLALLTMWMSERLAHLRAAMKPRYDAVRIATMVGRDGFPTGF